MKISLVRAEFSVWADGRTDILTDRHDQANSGSSQICKGA
jgi:hypothetical protein